MSRKIRSLLLISAVILAIVAVGLIVLTAVRPRANPALPNPNGYDDFVKAAGLLTGDVGNANTLDRDGLQTLVSMNSQSLSLLRLGLTRQSALPDSFMTNFAGTFGGFARLKQFAHLLVAEGRLMEMDNRGADAARSYVDTIRFGNEMSRGGFVIYRLVGISCEAIGETPLSRLVPKLNKEEARGVLAALEKIDSNRVTWTEVRQNERRFVQHRKGFMNPITWVTSWWQNWTLMRHAEMVHKRIIAHLRLLTAELALGIYRTNLGIAPKTLGELVPKYLRRVPSDPFSGNPMIYHAAGTNWLLYSVGEDGIDDGGKRVGRSSVGTVAKGDLFYDSPY